MNPRVPDLIAEIYWRLRAGRGFSHVEISRQLGIDRATYDAAIRNLIALGALVPAPATALGVTTRPLRATMDNLAAVADEAAEKHLAYVRLLPDLVTLALSGQRTYGDHLTEPLGAETNGGPPSAIAVFREMAETAHSEILDIQSEPPAYGADSQFDTYAHELLTRGVALRTLYKTAAAKTPSAMTLLEMLSLAGAQLRITPMVPFRLVIADNAAAYVAIPVGGEPELSLLSHDPLLIKLLRRVFDYCWLHAAPLTGRPSKDEQRPTDRQRSIVRMLHDGMTDDAMARELGVSVRTVRRQIADVLATLGARSRFQAGAIAQQLGWLA